MRFTRLLVVVLGSLHKVQRSRVRARGTVASGTVAESAATDGEYRRKFAIWAVSLDRLF